MMTTIRDAVIGLAGAIKNSPAWWTLDAHMPKVDRAYQKVRGELRKEGLVADEVYLDSVEVEISMIPSMGEAGYVYDETVPLLAKMVGFRKGVIYLPSDIPGDLHVPGGTLLNTIRHEYAHAWYAFDSNFFEEPWFKKAFGAEYSDMESIPGDDWQEKLDRSRNFKKEVNRCRNDRESNALVQRCFKNDFVSNYASTLAKEDFAETFMTYLRYRNTLDRFKERKGIYKKIKAIERAICVVKKKNGLSSK